MPAFQSPEGVSHSVEFAPVFPSITCVHEFQSPEGVSHSVEGAIVPGRCPRCGSAFQSPEGVSHSVEQHGVIVRSGTTLFQSPEGVSVEHVDGDGIPDFVSIPRRGKPLRRVSFDFTCVYYPISPLSASVSPHFRRANSAFRALFPKPYTSPPDSATHPPPKKGHISPADRNMTPNARFPPSCHVLARFTRRGKRLYNNGQPAFYPPGGLAMLNLHTMLGQRTHRDLEN